MVAEINPETGPGFRIIYTNAAFSRIFGYAADEVVGRSPRLLQGPETCADTIREISAVVHGGSSIRRRILNYNKAGRPVWVDVNIVPLPGFDGEIRRFAAIERDVTNEVRHEAQLEQLAYVDPLTKLANRRYFEQTLQRELSRAQRLHLPLSLAILDIDHFKQVNDRWGHPIGDRVIHGVAQSLLKSVRAYDCIARIGGEEFTVLLPGADLDAGKRVIDRVCADVRTTVKVELSETTVTVTCSAGLTARCGAADAGDKMILRADRALYMAKNAGRNRVAVFDSAEDDAGDSGPGPAWMANASATAQDIPVKVD
ncbi:MAG: diguanylate cyclase [Alphaproteobacteria bacterium]|nr:diguanylate cyclase [Alphaproteobacteria bacterium]